MSLDPRIFHITHVDNLAGILREGGVWSDAQCIARGLVPTNIGHRHIKRRRLERAVTTRAGGTLGDYVPFNFCPRSVMLYVVNRGHDDYAGGQTDIVHLVSRVSTAIRQGRPWAFTDRHAELAHIVRRLVAPRFILNFPTKKHWRNPSKLEYIRDGLDDLVRQVRALAIRSIALPPLGCGHGGLDWGDVRPLIEAALVPLSDVRVVLYAPNGAPAADAIIDRRKTPRMTAARAAVLALMSKYLETGYDYRLSLLEVQKLAYFLQESGEPLRLKYVAHYYGPYADDLRKSLRNMEGHYTRGVGDGNNSPETPLEMLPGAIEAATAFLADQPESARRLERVARLIEGFETPFGMELLATVHWVARGHASAGLEAVKAGVHAWSDRKRSQMKDGHIRAAWSRLVEMGWVAAPA